MASCAILVILPLLLASQANCWSSFNLQHGSNSFWSPQQRAPVFNPNPIQPRLTSICCQQFSKPIRRCFDLSKCPESRFASGASLFGPPSFDQFDFDLQNMCTCGGGSIRTLCCPSDDLAAGGQKPWVTNSNPPPREQQQHQDQGTIDTDMKAGFQQGHSNKNRPSLNPSPTPTRAPTVTLNSAPAETSNDKTGASIYSLTWTPPTKSKVLSHRNLNLLPSLDKCGVLTAPVRPAPYVVGGVDSRMGTQPWMALLGFSDRASPGEEPGWWCAGTLISPSYILTAAHCVFVPLQGYFLSTVRLGEFDQSKDKDCDSYECAPPVQDIKVAEIIPHKEYSQTTIEHDIALIRLDKSAKLGPYVTPICLPMYDVVRKDVRLRATNDRLKVAGWGRTQWAVEAGSDVLQEVSVPLIDRGSCQAYYSKSRSPKVINDGRFCAGGDLRRDSCKGDSGGPIMSPEKLRSGTADAETEDREVQFGIVSLGATEANCSEAGAGHPTLYTKIEHNIPWILDNMKP